MKYTMKAGVLYAEEQVVARIKGVFTGPEKKIFSADGTLALHTDIHSLPKKEGDRISSKQYILSDENEVECIVGKPGYASGEDPAVVGWPVCRMPRVDHAQLVIFGKDYRLVMQNSQNYFLSELSGERVMQIFHRGLAGGWNIEAADHFTPEIICGIFVFCKYIELENEFLVV